MNTVCNKCGQTIEHTEEIIINFNYGSSHDMETWNFRLCDDCLEEFVKNCVIIPDGYGKTGYEEYNDELAKIYG